MAELLQAIWKWVENIYSNVISEFIAALAFAAIAWVYYKLRRFARKQKLRDEEQDRRLEEWEEKLDREIKTKQMNFFEDQRLEAYPEIRRIAQKARDQAKRLQDPHTFEHFDKWLDEIALVFDEVLETLHRFAYILEFHGHYKYFHAYKNSLLSLKATAQICNPEHERGKESLLEILNEFLMKYDELVSKIKASDNRKSSKTQQVQSN